MSHYNGHDATRCWACGTETDAPVRGLCTDCFTLLQRPGRIGHALPEGPAAMPPFVAPLAPEPRPAVAGL